MSDTPQHWVHGAARGGCGAGAGCTARPPHCRAHTLRRHRAPHCPGASCIASGPQSRPQNRAKVSHAALFHATEHGRTVAFPVGCPRYLAPEVAAAEPARAANPKACAHACPRDSRRAGRRVGARRAAAGADAGALAAAFALLMPAERTPVGGSARRCGGDAGSRREAGAVPACRRCRGLSAPLGAPAAGRRRPRRAASRPACACITRAGPHHRCQALLAFVRACLETDVSRRPTARLALVSPRATTHASQACCSHTSSSHRCSAAWTMRCRCRARACRM